MGIIYESGYWGPLNFVLLTIILGGAASLAAGRALATTWRPMLHCALYALPIAAVVGFLHYAVFQESVIPLYALGAAVAELGQSTAAGLGKLAMGLRGFLALFIIHAALALLGYRLKRVQQMTTQYKFAFLPDGFINWCGRT